MCKQILCVLICFFLSFEATASEPAGSKTDENFVCDIEQPTIEQIDRGILWLMRKASGKKIARNDKYRRVFSALILDVATTECVPGMLLTNQVYRESTFRMNAIGKKGEKGLVQVMNPKQWGCDMSTERGQIECGAQYLRRGFDKCKTWKGALVNYQSRDGLCVAPRNTALKSATDGRHRKWQRLERVVSVDLSEKPRDNVPERGAHAPRKDPNLQGRLLSRKI